MANTSDGTTEGECSLGNTPTTQYIESLRSWLTQVYQMNCLAASFPYFLASVQAAQGSFPSSPTYSTTTTTTTTSTTTTSPPQASNATTPPPQPAPAPQQQQQQTQQQQNQRGVEYRIPPLWKRLLAETIDFLLLFAIKLAVTFAAVDAFDLLSEVEKYDLESLRADLLSDYRLAFTLTSDILVLELIHRVGSCVFEALCLHRGTGGGVGGATPGKKVVGLRVVRCQWLAPTTNHQALIYPANDLGLCRAVVRSAVKTFSLTFLFPICFTFFSLHHSRTFYDVVAGSVVVEEGPIPRTTPTNNNNNNNRNDNNNNNM